MNREIKFRAWNAEFGEMIFSDMNHEFCDKREWYPICFEIGFSNFPHTIIEENTILMQFTGLKDKNGKEIYEGDILITETEKPMIVKWNEKFASWCLYRDGWMFAHWFGESCNPENCEIIGNIYENPELLK